MHNFKELKIWRRSLDFAVKIYAITKNFPKEELFGLSLQMRKAASSIPNNIAEGSGRNTNKDFYHFLAIAYGSGCELETQIILAWHLEYFTAVEYQELVKELEENQKMLHNFKLTIQTKIIT